MKKITSLLLCFAAFLQLSAQTRLISTPKLSPLEKTQLTVGMVDIELEYSRPSMRGRKIFGSLVPYDKIWRTGANKNTKIIFHDAVQIGDQVLEAGTYTIFTKPEVDQWEVYFHTLLDKYGAPDELEDNDLKIRLTVPTMAIAKPVETLSIRFENIEATAADLIISWEQTAIAIPISTALKDLMPEKLALATTTLAEDYSTAAWNYFDIEKDTPKALAAINYAIALTERGKTFSEWLSAIDVEDWSLPWAYQIKSEMHAANGEMDQALAAAQRSLQIARKVKEGDAYIKKNTSNIEHWKKR